MSRWAYSYQGKQPPEVPGGATRSVSIRAVCCGRPAHTTTRCNDGRMSPPAPTIGSDRAHHSRARPLGGLVAAVAGLLVGVPVTTWWAVGDRSPHVAATLTYDLGPYTMAPGLERALGLLALTVTVLCLAILIPATARRRLPAIWWAALAPAIVAGVILALAWRAATAGFVGATIGGGALALTVGGFLAVVLAAIAVVVAVIIARGSVTASPG